MNVREERYAIDLPGDWEEAESAEEATRLYRGPEDEEAIAVTLLAVRPLFNIADEERLMSDYVHHRSSYEKGQRPEIAQSETLVQRHQDAVEGYWQGYDPEADARVRHRVLLSGGVLADFAYESKAEDEVFEYRANEVLGSAAIIAEG